MRCNVHAATARPPAVRQLCALMGPSNARQFLILSFGLILPWLGKRIQDWEDPDGRSLLRTLNIRTNSSSNAKHTTFPSFGWARARARIQALLSSLALHRGIFISFFFMRWR